MQSGRGRGPLPPPPQRRAMQSDAGCMYVPHKEQRQAQCTPKSCLEQATGRGLLPNISHKSVSLGNVSNILPYAQGSGLS